MSTKIRPLLGACLLMTWLPFGGCVAMPSKASPVNVVYRPPSQPVRTVQLNDRAQPLRKPRATMHASARPVQFTHRAEAAPPAPTRSTDSAAMTPATMTPAPMATMSPGTGRAVSPVGLFGEQVGPMGATDASYDAGMNLAPMSFATEGTCFDPDVDRTGRYLVFASTTHTPTADIYMKSTTGRTLTQITNDPAEDVMPTFSPDGRGIAFASNRSGNWDIYLTTTDGGQPTQVTSDSDHEVHPSWSPDGRRLSYSKFGSQSGRWEIWVIDLENVGVSRFLEYGLFPKWSPDVARSKILFQRARQRGSRYHSIWTIDFVNGEAMHPTEIVSAANAALISPAWSPDGRRIVFTSVIEPEPGSPPERAQIWMVNLDGTGRTNVIGGRFANTQPVWGGDGNVYFVSNRSGVDNIWAASIGRSPMEYLDLDDDAGMATVDPDSEPRGGRP